MFAYGVCVGSEAKYRAYAHAGIRASSPESPLLERRGQTSIFVAYNSILDEARGLPSLDGLVLVHDDTEIRDPDIESKLADLFTNTEAVIAGVIGGRGARSIQWGQAAQRFGHAPDAHYGENDYGRGTHEVDIVDGLLLALSPWALENLRFDSDTFDGFHAYDADLCMQARRAGRKVVVTDIELFHHTKGGYGDVSSHRRSDLRFRRKWGMELDPLPHRIRRRLAGKPY
jgi:hypothetical protein